MPQSFTFQIEISGFTSVIAVTGRHTLEELAFAILKSVGFQCDHCFGFYDNLEYALHSREEYTVFADLGETDNKNDPGVSGTLVHQAFQPGKRMIFLFDYGDNWQFVVTCLRVEDIKKTFRRPKILETQGTPPTQYAVWQEEEGEEN